MPGLLQNNTIQYNTIQYNTIQLILLFIYLNNNFNSFVDFNLSGHNNLNRDHNIYFTFFNNSDCFTAIKKESDSINRWAINLLHKDNLFHIFETLLIVFLFYTSYVTIRIFWKS